MDSLRIALYNSFLFSFSLLIFLSVLLGILKNGTKLILFAGGEVLREQYVELQAEVTSSVVHHQGRQGVVVQDGHTLAFQNSGRARRNNFIRGDFEQSAIQRGEFKRSHCECIQKADVVLVDQAVSFSSVFDVSYSGENNGQVTSKLISRSVAFTREV